MIEWNLPNENKIHVWAKRNGFQKELAELKEPNIRKWRTGKVSSKAETIEQRLRLKYLQVNKPRIYKRIKKNAKLRAKRLRETNDPLYEKIIQRAREHSFGLKLKFSDILGGKCEMCGYKKHPCALQFHHKNPQDKWSKTTFSGYLQDPIRFEKDIKEGKIMLLCSNCHHILHFNQKRKHRIGDLKKRG